MARSPRRLMRQGTADLPNEAAVDAYKGPYGEIVVTPKGLRVQDGITAGGIRMVAEAFLGAVALSLPSGLGGTLASLLGLASDFIVSPAAGETVTVPLGVARVVVRGGAEHFRLVLPPLTSDGRLRIEVEEGTQQTRTTVQFIPAAGDTITDGFVPAGRVPISVQFDTSTSLVRSAAVWTIGDASTPVPSLKLDLVNGQFQYGYLGPPVSRTLAQTLSFTNGASGSTYVDASGVCRDALVNTLRETFDPATKAYLGPLFEGTEGQNWFPNPTNSSGFSVNTNAVGSPALSTDVPAFRSGAPIYKLTPDSGNTFCGSISVDVPANSIVCPSIYLWIPPDCSGTLSDIFQIQNVTSGLTNLTIQKAAFDLRGCWQRVWCVIQNTSANSITSQVRFVASGIRSPGDVQFPNRSMYVTCPQVERGVDTPSSFIPNATATVPAVRAADTVAFAANQPLDTLSGFTLAAEMVAPLPRQSGACGGVGLGNNATGTIASARMRAFGDPTLPYLDVPLTARTSAAVALLKGSPIIAGRALRSALAVTENDIVLEDGGGARVAQTVGNVPDGLGQAAIIDAVSSPVILRRMEVYCGF